MMIIKQSKTRSFTLLEIITVTIIIGILATLSISHFTPVRENIFDREAKASLKLIIAAEKIYRMEQGAYFVAPACATDPKAPILSINNELKLSLPADEKRAWDYYIVANNVASPPTCCAEANRTSTGSRQWNMNNSQTDPLSGACP